jgi:hypothetical protein
MGRSAPLSHEQVYEVSLGIPGMDALPSARLVISRFDKLGDSVEQAAKSQGAPLGGIHGVHWRGRTFLMLNSLPSRETCLRSCG